MDVYQDIIERRKQLEKDRAKSQIRALNQKEAERDAAARRRALQSKLKKERPRTRALDRTRTAQLQEDDMCATSYRSYSGQQDDEEDFITEFVKESMNSLSELFSLE